MSTAKTRKPPTDDPPSLIGILRQLATDVAAIAQALTAPKIDPEIQLYTPAQAAEALGVTENWVVERMDDQAIPFAYVGRFRRMRLKHIRAVAEANEIDPTRRGRKLTSAA